MIPHVIEAEVCGPHLLRLVFDDGTGKVVDLSSVLTGPIFEPLQTPNYFALVSIDEVAGTVVWPNGADFAPEALYEFPDKKVGANKINSETEPNSTE